MPENSAKSSSPKVVSFEDCASLLGLSLQGAKDLISTAEYKLTKDKLGRPAISHTDFVLMSSDPAVVLEVNRTANRDAVWLKENLTTHDEQFLREEIARKLAAYKGYIAVLSTIHFQHLQYVDPLHTRTPLAAAYLLFARVINLLNMGVSTLESGYWNAGVLLRQIDETIQLAEYFSQFGTTVKGQREIASWFRDNRTPEPKKVRTALAKRHAEIMGVGNGEEYLATMDHLYNLKSKWIHPTFAPIRETISTRPVDNGVNAIGFDYGPCKNPITLHELVLFYRPSIWTSVQGFIHCFAEPIPLGKDDLQKLFELDQKFNVEPDGLQR